MEPYPAALAIEIAEPERGPGGVLDEPVRPLGSRVGDPGFKEAQDLGPPGVDGLGKPGRFGYVDGGDGLVEAVQPGGDGVSVAGGQQLAQ